MYTITRNFLLVSMIAISLLILIHARPLCHRFVTQNIFYIASSIFILVYSLSAYFHYQCTRKCHFHPHGRGYNQNPQKSDIIIMFFPFLNTISSIGYFTGSWKDEKYRKKDYSDFFNPPPKIIEKIKVK